MHHYMSLFQKLHESPTRLGSDHLSAGGRVLRPQMQTTKRGKCTSFLHKIFYIGVDWCKWVFRILFLGFHHIHFAIDRLIHRWMVIRMFFLPALRVASINKKLMINVFCVWSSLFSTLSVYVQSLFVFLKERSTLPLQIFPLCLLLLIDAEYPRTPEGKWCKRIEKLNDAFTRKAREVMFKGAVSEIQCLMKFFSKSKRRTCHVIASLFHILLRSCKLFFFV